MIPALPAIGTADSTEQFLWRYVGGKQSMGLSIKDASHVINTFYSERFFQVESYKTLWNTVKLQLRAGISGSCVLWSHSFPTRSRTGQCWPFFAHWFMSFCSWRVGKDLLFPQCVFRISSVHRRKVHDVTWPLLVESGHWAAVWDPLIQSQYKGCAVCSLALFLQLVSNWQPGWSQTSVELGAS